MTREEGGAFGKGPRQDQLFFLLPKHETLGKFLYFSIYDIFSISSLFIYLSAYITDYRKAQQRVREGEAHYDFLPYIYSFFFCVWLGHFPAMLAILSLCILFYIPPQFRKKNRKQSQKK